MLYYFYQHANIDDLWVYVVIPVVLFFYFFLEKYFSFALLTLKQKDVKLTLLRLCSAIFAVSVLILRRESRFSYYYFLTVPLF